MTFTLTSPAFADGGTLPHAQLFNGMGQTGENRSPALRWTGAPAGTKSFALTVYDPDAPTGSGWWHWIVVNLPATTNGLTEGASPGALPEGALETRTDFGAPGYGGAAPPPGAPHRYIFTVHALGIDHLDLSPDASGAMAGFLINANRLASASLTALYGHGG
ncbi:kinase inhibitor phospholipid-binding protein [Ameyamaea chiangmaiensis NBRC 103196]|uniref:Kinase inhibitor n=1 Tax=Ameyamaea chiangmaiensis TaxID=442969 RepID=A0A850PI24_9PROT|nr:kinase inhibitor [Ameyamaea chiangmaiensis]MBS4075798.1 kinase inhibitor [Ameyamaea chiangmaiensis]NVN40861.1 kinase inhibitor [Ameyamaea chiangmaiensis]GBQ63776.1 kinase inhibitor phospholipid-binding protein [Ameyamaea chiangmaiensis NBRC 103196]